MILVTQYFSSSTRIIYRMTLDIIILFIARCLKLYYNSVAISSMINNTKQNCSY